MPTPPPDMNIYTYDDGIQLIRFALSLDPHQSALFFYLACFYSALHQTSKALFYYEQALKRGFRDWHQICSSPSFASARAKPKFKTITAKYLHPLPPAPAPH